MTFPVTPFRAYIFESVDPTNMVPSAPITGDEITSAPVEYVHFTVPVVLLNAMTWFSAFPK